MNEDSYVQYNHAISCKCDVRTPGVILVDGEVVKHDGKFSVECVPKSIPILARVTYQNTCVASVKRARGKGVETRHKA